MKAFIVLFALMLTGCASHTEYGTYSQIPPGYRDIIAIDAANQLASIYPPASTNLLMAIEPKDDFGQAFVARMRLLGFSIQESPDSTSGAQSLRIGYVLDNLDERTFRLLITTGNSALSRAYTNVGSRFSPAGLWARREG
jgi:hypothetical protein